MQRLAGSFRPASWRVVVECVIAAVLVVTLLTYALIGGFTRYVADDYGAAIAVRLRGFWAEQVAAYRLSDGHFVATALQTAVASVDPVVVRILPGVLIAAWVALLVLGLRHLVPAAGLLGRILIAAAIVYTTIHVAPSPFLTFYWMTASLAFVVPLLLAAVLAWLVSRPSGTGRRGMLVIAFSGVVALIAGGEAEAYTVAQAVAVTLALALALSRLSAVWRSKLPVLLGAWIGSVAGLGIELASPGNAIRAGTISQIVVAPRPSLLGLPFFTFVKTLHFARILAEAHWGSLLALLLLAGLLGARSGAVNAAARRLAVIAVALTTVGTLAVVAAALAPAARVYGTLPPLYDQIVPVYVCVCSMAALGWVGGRFCRSVADTRWPAIGERGRARDAVASGIATLVGAAVLIGPVATLASIRHDLPALQAYAGIKDTQAADATAAHAAGLSSAVVPTLPDYKDLGIFSHTGLEEPIDDPSYFINKDEAEFYGIVSLATPPGPTPPP